MDTDSTSSSSSSNSNGVIVTADKERRMRIENPFTLKVGQVFTGFGIGCGIGIGVGRPLNLGTRHSFSFLLINQKKTWNLKIFGNLKNGNPRIRVIHLGVLILFGVFVC